MALPLQIGLLLAVAGGLVLAERNGPQERAYPRQQGGPKMAADTQVPGDPVKGLAIFEGKGVCLSCHRVADEGSKVGPDLSDIADQLTLAELQKSLLDPTPGVQPKNQLYRVVTRDGKSITGRLLNQDEFTIQMMGSDEQLHAFARSNLRESGFIATPPMPSYRDKLSADEQTNLIAFLVSLKSANPKQ